MCLSRVFCRRDTDEGDEEDFEKVIKVLTKVSGAPSVTKMKLQYEEMRIGSKTDIHNLHSDMNDREPGFFYTQSMSCEIHVRIKTFFNPWSELM